jgi:hypothetical protein
MARTPRAVGVDELCFTPAVGLRAALRSRELSSRELVGALLDRIERVNPAVNAFVTVLGEQALEQATLADQQTAKSDGRSQIACHCTAGAAVLMPRQPSGVPDPGSQRRPSRLAARL